MSSAPVKKRRSKRKLDQVTVHLRLKGATELPKVSMMGQMDAYVKFDGGGHEFKSTVVPNSKSPTWDLDCFFNVDRRSDGLFQGVIEFSIFDKSRFGDSLVGIATLDLGEYEPDDLTEVSLRVDYAQGDAAKYAKQGRDSQLHVGVLGSMVSYAGFCKRLRDLPGVYFMQRTQHVYFPVPGQKRLMAGIHYSPDAVEFKVALTKPNSNFFIDMDHGSNDSTKLVKACYQQGNPDITELKIYEEVTTQGLMLTEEFDQTVLGCCQRELLHSYPVNEALARAGWKGPGTKFEAAALDMAELAIVDVPERCIYTAVGPNSSQPPPRPRSRRLKPPNHEALLMLDYRPYPGASKLPRLKLCVMAIDANSGRAYDIMIPQGRYEVPSELFAEPLPILHDSQFVSRTLEVLDLANPAVLHGAQVMVYELTDCQSWTLQDLIQPKGRVEGQQEEHKRVDVQKTFEDGLGGLTTGVVGLATQFGKVALTVGKTADWAVTGAAKGAFKGISGVVAGVAETAVGIKDVGQHLVTTGIRNIRLHGGDETAHAPPNMSSPGQSGRPPLSRDVNSSAERDRSGHGERDRGGGSSHGERAGSSYGEREGTSYGERGRAGSGQRAGGGGGGGGSVYGGDHGSSANGRARTSTNGKSSAEGSRAEPSGRTGGSVYGGGGGTGYLERGGGGDRAPPPRRPASVVSSANSRGSGHAPVARGRGAPARRQSLDDSDIDSL